MGAALEKELRDKLEPALGLRSWHVNPLEAIGLNTDLLSIGIPPAELFRAVKSYVRQLAAIVHPDMGSTAIAAKRAQGIRDAFETLQEYSDFQSALSRLVQEQDEGKRELQESKNLIELQGNQIAKLEQSLSEGKLHRQNIENERGELAQYKADVRVMQAWLSAKQSDAERKQAGVIRTKLQLESERHEKRDLELLMRNYLLHLPAIKFSGRIRFARTSLLVFDGKRVKMEKGQAPRESAVIGSVNSRSARGGPGNILQCDFWTTIEAGRYLVQRHPGKLIRVSGEIVSLDAKDSLDKSPRSV